MSKLTKALTAAAGNAGGESLYVEDVFSTYLYDGVSSAITITNGIDLADAGGLVWTKRRATDARSHILFDSERGASSRLMTDQTAAAANQPYSITMNSDGYSWSGADNDVTIAGSTYASWSFRKAEKFFDVVTYTGNGTATNNISHNLGDVPGFIVVKRTDSDGNWCVAAGDSSGNYRQLTLNNSGQSYVSTAKSNIADSSIFNAGYLGVNFDGSANQSGGTYVAYLFASDAGGFGDDGSESIIKCGSYTGGSAGLEVNLGFEPQWILIKRTNAADDWVMYDVMRGMPVGGDSAELIANANYAENGYFGSSQPDIHPNATGFTLQGTSSPYNNSGSTYIYIAIRRPMKTPESGTEVFGISAGGTTSPGFISSFPIDAAIGVGTEASNHYFSSRLTDKTYMLTTSTAAEATNSYFSYAFQNGYYDSTSAATQLAYMFKRATGFFDVVAYTGNATANRQITHNLNAVPELMLAKTRDAANYWVTYDATNGATNYMVLNTAVASASSIDHWYNTTPTASVVTLGDGNYTNRNATQQILYLFASVAGVSKVGSYTGTGSNVDVDCGFSAGARFILIKRTDSTGDWYVWDSVRGIVAGNDPYLLLNSTAAEVTSTDYIDPLSSGFTVTSSAPAALNASGGTYIFMAIS